MKVDRLYLFNFRNFTTFESSFDNQNIIFGPNGSGKSNLLEAIYILSSGRSFRTVYLKELINNNLSSCRIVARIFDDLKEGGIEVLISFDKENQKTKKKIKKDIEFFCVLFSPDSMDLVLGSPSFRRRTLDLFLSMLSKKYTKELLGFIRVLKHRNKILSLLKEGKSEVERLDFWDEEFIKRAQFLWRVRAQVIKKINEYLPSSIHLVYLPALKAGLKDLKKERAKEVSAGFSLFGPHKDDFLFVKDKKPLYVYGSRGEIREAVFFYKLAEWQCLKEKTGRSPVLLLDDIFSELDPERQKRLLFYTTKAQTIFTTTSLSFLPPAVIKRSKLIELK